MSQGTKVAQQHGVQVRDRLRDDQAGGGADEGTLLLDAGVDTIKEKELLGHRHVTTTQIHDKRRRSLKEGASHDVPI